MPAPDLPEVPASMKSIQHYLKIATEHDGRDPVVSYWARLYAAQTALGITKKKSPEENLFLVKLMNWLEDTKKELHDNEAISNDVAAQAHLENWALKLFLYADKNDRASNFSKNVIHSFYTAGLLYDVLTIFGELGEEASQNRKYAKWKAAYIHNCLKNGETPIPGPIDQQDNNAIQPKSETDDVADDESGIDSELNPAPENDLGSANRDDQPNSDPENSPEDNLSLEPADEEVESESQDNIEPTSPSNQSAFGFPSVPNNSNINVNPSPFVIPQNPNLPSDLQTINSPTSTPSTPQINISTSQTGNISLNPDQMQKAQKYIKWAGSAINYDDVTTAVSNLQKALHLLTTGEDS